MKERKSGANTGIGKSTARTLAMKGANVYFACRNQIKTEITMNEVNFKQISEKIMEIFIEKFLLDREGSWDFKFTFFGVGFIFFLFCTKSGI